jgi:hypothetical protein
VTKHNREFVCVLCEDKTHENLNVREIIETVLCAAVGKARHQNGLAVCTVYADRTVCSCRHSKSSEACTVFVVDLEQRIKITKPYQTSARKLVLQKVLRFYLPYPQHCLYAQHNAVLTVAEELHSSPRSVPSCTNTTHSKSSAASP